MLSRSKKIILFLSAALALECAAVSLRSCYDYATAPGNRIVTAGVLAVLGIGLAQHLKVTYGSGPRKQVSHFYQSKESKELVEEPVEWPVKVVYADNPFSWILASFAGGYMGKRVTDYAGSVANDPQATKGKIAHYESLYKDGFLDMNQFRVPQEGFKTFNEWFTREFNNIEQARPCSIQPAAIVSPADSKLLIIPDLSQDTTITIKEQRFNIEKFLGNKALAHRYEGGVMMIFRLAPYDYHRYHFPFDCVVGAEQCIAGAYHSVNPRAFNVGCKPLTENKRAYEILTPVGTCQNQFLNEVVMVQVGATAVASIVNTFMEKKTCRVESRGYEMTYKTGRVHAREYKKGEQAGYFQFGGSTVVLLFPRNTIIPDAQIVENSNNGYETAVRVRETVATWMDNEQALKALGK